MRILISIHTIPTVSHMRQTTSADLADVQVLLRIVKPEVGVGHPARLLTANKELLALVAVSGLFLRTDILGTAQEGCI